MKPFGLRDTLTRSLLPMVERQRVERPGGVRRYPGPPPCDIAGASVFGATAISRPRPPSKRDRSVPFARLAPLPAETIAELIARRPRTWPQSAPGPVGCRFGSCRPAAVTRSLPRRSAGYAVALEVPLTVVAEAAVADGLLEIEAEAVTGPGRSSHARGA